MKATKKGIIDKTHYGLNIYAYILRQYYPGETVLSLSGRDCKPTKNPFNSNRETLVVKVADGCAIHSDTENAIQDGDVFDFAEIHFKLQEQDLLDKINEVMNLRLGEEKSFYKEKRQVYSEQTTVNKPEVSPVFSYFLNPVRNTTPLKEVSLVEVFNKIKSLAYKPQTEKLRSFENKREAKSYKAGNFHYVTFSGVFSKRNDADLMKHSGLLTVDFDHIEDIPTLKSKLLADEYFETEILFVSPSGDGLKWVLQIDLLQATHQEYFLAISNYVKHTYGFTIDQSGKDVSRACFLPHDSEVYINPKYI